MSELTPKMDGIAEAQLEKESGPWSEAWRGSERVKWL